MHARPRADSRRHERVDVQRGGQIHVDAETPLQIVNDGIEDLLSIGGALTMYLGAPPEPSRHSCTVRPVAGREARSDAITAAPPR